LAKNLKLQVKNVQIAGAINLRGLKAKLSKKKPEDEEEVEEKALAKKKRTPSKTKKEPVQKGIAANESGEQVVERPSAVAGKKEIQENNEIPVKNEIQEKSAIQKRDIQESKAFEPAAKAQEKTESQAQTESKSAVERKAFEKTVPVKQEERLGPVFKTTWREVPTGSLARQRTPHELHREEDRGGRERRPYEGKPREGGPQDRKFQDKKFQDRRFQDRRPDDRRSEDRRSDDRRSDDRRPEDRRSDDRRPDDRRFQDRRSQDRRPQDRPYSPRDARRTPPLVSPKSQQVPPKEGQTLGQNRQRAQEKKEVQKKEFRNLETELFKGPKQKGKEAKEAQKPAKQTGPRQFDAAMRHGFRSMDDEEQVWRKKRPSKMLKTIQEQEVIRPSKISVQLPISVKDLAQEMKIKASELISKLFLQGVVVTLNDLLDDETVVQLLGHEFGCEIHIDTREAERVQITGKSIQEEIAELDPAVCVIRPPVVAFMGHVDHGKTSIIDSIRKSNRVQHEVGAITQHIGAFRCHTDRGNIAILDTPGHEAFSHMRKHGAQVTDIVVLVVAGDEGMKEQTYEALEQAQSSNASIVVALNKCDKPAFNPENVYRQLAEKNLLPEAWGGQTITVNCSAVTGEGIKELLEMLALQAEVLELKANPSMRARGAVIESQVDKGLGPVATVLVQNGTLKVGDCLVFGYHWARVKTMRDQDAKNIQEAAPSTPVRINGLSGLPESGEEFIVVDNEREAREISELRREGRRQSTFLTKKKLSFEGLVEKAQDKVQKKILNVMLRADVQGSLEALKNALLGILSDKVEVQVISAQVGLITESDVERAQVSKSHIIGFHTHLESHLEPVVKELGVDVRLHDIIYHAVDDVRELMKLLLDKIEQEKYTGKLEVKALFKSSQLGVIAGCQVLDGSITRNSYMRVLREGSEVFKGSISSLKRQKDDVREVQKGMECGILTQGFSEYQVGDIVEAFDIIYLTQDL